MVGLMRKEYARFSHLGRVKEFEGLPSTSQQVNRVRQILTDLGMTGRMSIEKAKEIREKREFEQEMRELLHCFTCH